MSFYLFINIAK